MGGVITLRLPCSRRGMWWQDRWEVASELPVEQNRGWAPFPSMPWSLSRAGGGLPSPPCPGLSPEQGVGSLPSMPRSPSITTSPEKRRPDPLPLPVSTTVPSKQKGQSPTLTNRQSACCISGLGVVFCQLLFLPRDQNGKSISIGQPVVVCMVQSPRPSWGT